MLPGHYAGSSMRRFGSFEIAEGKLSGDRTSDPTARLRQASGRACHKATSEATVGSDTRPRSLERPVVRPVWYQPRPAGRVLFPVGDLKNRPSGKRLSRPGCESSTNPTGNLLHPRQRLRGLHRSAIAGKQTRRVRSRSTGNLPASTKGTRNTQSASARVWASRSESLATSSRSNRKPAESSSAREKTWAV